MKRLLLLVINILWFSTLFATHNRAGEITCRQISGLRYELTLITYTYTPSYANEFRDFLDINWGDSDKNEKIPRISHTDLPDNYTKNIYKAEHTFPGAGVYKIVMEDPNRNEGVHNIPGSVNVVFSIATILKIDALLGFNSTPQLLNPPLDKATVGQPFIHNPGAYDAEGDSISYGLSVCLQENGKPIEGYSFPPTSNVLYVDSLNGDFVWDSPTETGIYNVAMTISEWRKGVKIGQIIRDMQIEVVESNNQAPNILPIENICVQAGDTVRFEIEAQDANLDSLKLTYTGEPFNLENQSASCKLITSEKGHLKYLFEWITSCDLHRKEPYQVTFKCKDFNSNLSLSDYEAVKIKVIAPPIKNLLLTPSYNTITLDWESANCQEETAFAIYRKANPSNWNPNDCQTGIPENIGFQLIATQNANMPLHYVDNNHNKGLAQGYSYCYRIVSLYDNYESYASEESCSLLESGYPLITQVSVDSTDNKNGKISLKWLKYDDFDTTIFKGDYHYLIYRSSDLYGNELELIDSTLSLNDTIYYDTQLNTSEKQYSYSIVLMNNEPNNRKIIGTPQIASMPTLELESMDNAIRLQVKSSTPWHNDSLLVYRYSYQQNTFDSLRWVNSETFTDTCLVNGEDYCYRVKVAGHYPESLYDKVLNNFSPMVCASPKDTEPPCPPSFSVISDCEEYQNKIYWQFPDSCKEDIKSINIYYTPVWNTEKTLLAEFINPLDTPFIHQPETSIAGCYSVTAVDSFMNESPMNKEVCVDVCTYYKLPNVFTPNNDGINDLYKPGPYKFVEKIDLKIYNRWGTLVFQTENPDINWDGVNQNNGKRLNDAAYYYICDVYEHRLSGLEVRNISGVIHIFTSEKIKYEK